MVQLPQRSELAQLTQLRQAFHWPAGFEIKYYRMKPRQKDIFFAAAQSLPFKARVVYLDKERVPGDFAKLNGQDLTIELITRLVLRVPELDLANDMLIADGATKAFRQALRARLSLEYRMAGRVRPFSAIQGASSRSEDGLQLADMIAGATRAYLSGEAPTHYKTFAAKVMDCWAVS